MKIEVDYNPTPKKVFFISVFLNSKEIISFDYTTKAHNVKKQVLIERKKFPKNQAISSEWDSIILRNGKFVKMYHVKWIDMGMKDWCNNEIWEIVSQKPISRKLTDNLLKFSQLISDNYQTLSKFSEEIKNFENLLSKEVQKFLV